MYIKQADTGQIISVLKVSKAN